MALRSRTLKALATLVACLPAASVACSGDTVPQATTDAGRRTDASPIVDAAASDTSQVSDASTADDFSLNIWPAASGPIVYWGGPIITGTPNVYFIWYGDWANSTTPAILEGLISNYGNTTYSSIMAGYYQSPQPPLVQLTLDGGDASLPDTSAPVTAPIHASGQYRFAGSTYVDETMGVNLAMGDVEALVVQLLAAGTVPYDNAGVYFVLTSSDVSESEFFGSFCSDYCGWHDGTIANSTRVQYAFVGDPGMCLDSCSVQQQFVEAGIQQSPNGNWSADSMASVIIHELSEATTDPFPSSDQAWLDEYESQEIGDMCAWRYDPTYVTANGSRANIRFGGRDFLIQQMWVNGSDGGGCGFHP
jgi:phosphate-induced protein 1